MVLMQRQKYIIVFKSQKYDYLNRIKNSLFWYHSILITLCMADANEDVLDYLPIKLSLLNQYVMYYDCISIYICFTISLF